MKYSDLKIFKLQVENQALQIDLKDDLQKIQHSQSPDLLPFYSNFEKIYPKFRPSLQKIISDITANELKLCALLRLNLSSKEIAQLLNITPESVNKARYRLRKKIALNSNDDLVIFLTSI
jgi:DNA-binding CsgD family transcriptional regulator